MSATLQPLIKKIRCQQGPAQDTRYPTPQQGDLVRQVCIHISSQGIDFCKAADSSTTPRDTYNTPLEKARSFVEN